MPWYLLPMPEDEMSLLDGFKPSAVSEWGWGSREILKDVVKGATGNGE